MFPPKVTVSSMSGPHSPSSVSRCCKIPLAGVQTNGISPRQLPRYHSFCEQLVSLSPTPSCNAVQFVRCIENTHF